MDPKLHSLIILEKIVINSNLSLIILCIKGFYWQHVKVLINYIY
jgi:hypothetical protein